MTDAPTKLSRKVLAAYSAPAFAQALIHGPSGSIIQGIYAVHFGLPLQSIALVLLLAGIADAVTNPLIGYSSDRFRARFGTRKPWLVAGALVTVIAGWFLYAPTPPVTTGYFLFWLLLAYLGWALGEIPYGGWIPEITTDYNERTRLTAWRASFMYLGAMAFFAIPFMPIFPTTEFTADTLKWTAILAAVTLPLLTFIALRVVPNGTAPLPPQAGARKNAWRAIVKNRPLLLFALMFGTIGLSVGVLNGVLFFFFDDYMHQGTALAGIFLIALPMGAVAVPLWGYLCRRFGKQQAWALSTAGGGLAICLYGLIQPGEYATLWLTVLHVIVVFMYVCYSVAAPAVLADVVDYGSLRFGADYAGTYFAFYLLMYKAVPQVGAAAGLALVGLFGFDPQLQEQTTLARHGLLFTFSLIPALLLLIAAPLIWYFPINARRQRIITRRLQATRRRAAAQVTDIHIENSSVAV